MALKNISLVSPNAALVYAALGFLAMALYTSGDIAPLFNIILLIACVVVLVMYIALRTDAVNMRRLSGILLFVCAAEWSYIKNMQDGWFASWKWALAICVICSLSLFTVDFKDICRRNGKFPAIMALTWLWLWMILHFINIPEGADTWIAVLWYTFTLTVAISVASGYIRHFSGIFLPLCFYLSLMDIIYYQIYPWIALGIVPVQSIPWIVI